MGQLSLTIVTSLVLFVTYYLIIFGVVVKASPVSSANIVERTAEDTSFPQQSQTDQTRNYGRVFKPFAYAYGFNRNIRTPLSNSISQRLAPITISHSRIQPLEMELVVDDDDEAFDKSKRYDDYGHMRFGKRGGDDQFDDYGHMRFGKRGE